jgi:hypothetical protein
MRKICNHEYYINENSKAECKHCGLLESTIKTCFSEEWKEWQQASADDIINNMPKDQTPEWKERKQPFNEDDRYHIHFNTATVDKLEALGIEYREQIPDQDMGLTSPDFQITAQNRRQVVGLLKSILDNCHPTDIHIYDTEDFK